MVQRTVLKVDLKCLKCKKKLLQAVSALEGVDKIEVDAGKGTLSVTGNADPYKIILSARKAAGKHADVVSVGPPPAPPKQPEGRKKPDEKNKGSSEDDEKKKKEAADKDEKKIVDYHQEPLLYHNPHTCPEYQRVAFVQFDRFNNNYEPNPSCSIM